MTVPLVPAYIWPTDHAAWDRATAGKPGIVVVTGDNSGPGTARNPDLQARITSLARRGWQPIAYVRLDYLRRPLGDVAADVVLWRRWYTGLRGVFFDECPPGGDALIGAIPMLASSVGGGTCVLNPGTGVSEDVWRATWPSRSLVVTFEGTADAYATIGAQVHPRAVHLVHQSPTVPEWPRSLGFAWSTPDGRDGNPWDATPTEQP